MMASLAATPLENLKKKITSTEERVRVATHSAEKAEEFLKQSECTIARLEKKLSEQEQERQKLQQESDSLQQSLASAQQQLKKTQSSFYEQLKTSYALGNGVNIKLFLLQKDPAALSRMLVYLDYLHGARLKNMAEIQHLSEAMNEEKALLTEKMEALQALQKTEEAARAIFGGASGT